MGAVSSVFKGVGSAFGLGGTPSYSIGTDPSAVKAATATANMTADLAQDNTPDIVTGGNSTADTNSALTSRRRKSTTGVASNLGIGG